MPEAGKTSKRPDHAELVSMVEESKSIDKDLFAEQRSNILLIASEHYSKGSVKYWNRIRDSRELSDRQKIRLTQNHMYKIMRGYANSITSFAPFVTCTPQDPKDLQDQKSAEIHNNVLSFAKQKYRLREKVRDWCDDFVGIGEVHCKIFFDPNLGKPVGREQEVDDEGNPVFDEFGDPAPSDNLVYSGDFVFESIYGFNLLRAASAKSFDDSPHLTIQKMLKVRDLKQRYAGDKEKLKAFEETEDRTYLVFDQTKSTYTRSKDEVLVYETYYRPCMQYPNGYFYYWTDADVFEEGELPLGIFPIATGFFDKFQTSPRGRSHIKVLRPFQVEINRAASKVAEHQTTLGDDKIITLAGTKLKEGGVLPGVRGITVAGATPTILPGRDGSQYQGYYEKKVAEMYQASLVQEEAEEKNVQQDPYTLLFRAASQKKRFSLYTERFEQFLVDVFTVFFELAREYMPEDDLLEAVGKSDIANLEEFRNPKKLGYLVKVEPQSDDIESKLGKQLVMNHFIQFAGDKIDRKDLGKFLRQSPYGNFEEAFSDLTMDEEIATNRILAIERGKPYQAHPHDDHPYLIKRFINRIMKPDFEVLHPQIQQSFMKATELHESMEAQKQQKLLAANADMIPTGGAQIIVDFYIPDPKNPLSSKRARVPYESLDWLLKRISAQGTTQEVLQGLPGQAQADIAQKMSQGQVQGRGQGLPVMPQNQSAMESMQNGNQIPAAGRGF